MNTIPDQGNGTDAAPLSSEEEQNVEPLASDLTLSAPGDLHSTETDQTRQRFFDRLEKDWPMPSVNRAIVSGAEAFTPAAQIEGAFAIIGTDVFSEALIRISDGFVLDAASWREQIKLKRPAFVIVEAELPRPGNAWRNIILDAASKDFWKNLCAYCASEGVPTILYIASDKKQAGLFLPSADSFSKIFVNRLCRDVLPATQSGIVEVETFIDSTIYNPYKNKTLEWRGLWKILPIVMGRAYSKIEAGSDTELNRIFEKLLDNRFWIYEDRYDLRNNNQRLSPVERSRFLGCFRGASRAALLKNASYEVFPKSLYSSSDPDDERHFFETLATKTLPLTDIEHWREEITKGSAADNQSNNIAEQLESCSQCPVSTAIKKHHLWRMVVSGRTYYDLLRQSFAVAGRAAEYNSNENARFSCIMPTVRPELIPMAVEFYQAQDYPDRELIIVLNTDDYDKKEIEKITANDPTIHVLYAPSSYTIGAAINLGISHMTGDYWAKLDDDDYYSPSYLSDINLYRKHIDFDLAGKSSIFNYFEKSDETILRSSIQADKATNNLAGGTLVVKKDESSMYWSETVRGYADVEFITRRLSEGAMVSSLDPFGYLQVRRADPKSHTWTKEASYLKADFVSDGLSLSSIYV